MSIEITRMTKGLNWVLSLLTIAVIVSCSSDSGSDDGTTTGGNNQDNFNRETMLINWADNIIIPSYISFKADADAMVTATTTFTTTPNQANLENLRAAWETAYLSFQNVSMFEIGKAEEERYRNRLNVYPTNTTEIEDFIASGSYDLSLPSTIDAQGFPALDYLIYGAANTDTDISALYSTNANADNYKQYLNELSQTIATLTDIVLTDWQTNFRDTFVANTSSSSTGSVDKLANDYILYYEKGLRAGKIGIPAGNFSNETLPENVEGFYRKDLSKALFNASLTATQNFFEGKHFNSNTEGESFKSYLNFLNTIKNGDDLSTLIVNQFEASRTQGNLLNDDFTQQIETDNSVMLLTFDELQRNVILLKVDMLQALDINVDFVDTDGD
jgi:hypothetical protein